MAAKFLQVDSDWLAISEGEPIPGLHGEALEVGLRFAALSDYKQQLLLKRLQEIESL